MKKYLNDNDYGSLKQYVDSLTLADFSDLPDVKPVDIGEFHLSEREVHGLDNSCIEIYKQRPYRIEIEWNFCKQCMKLRNHKIILYDNTRSFCYTKYLVKHGAEQ